MSRRVVSHTLSSLGTGGPDAGAGAGAEHGGAPGLDGLDLSAYSLMKHGHLPSINLLADHLTQDLLDAEPRLLDPRLRITLPVAYLAVLPACGHLAHRMAQRLTEARDAAARDSAGQNSAGKDSAGKDSAAKDSVIHTESAAEVRVVRIAKSAVASIDYASATAQERRDQMSALSFTLDPGLDLDGDVVVLVDDVRITGLAEQAAVRALAQASRPAEIITAYVAAATPALATDPSVERALNHAVVTEPSQLLPAMCAGEFALTIRYLKWALSTQPVAPLLEALPAELAAQMARGAADSGLWGRPEYAEAQAWFRASSLPSVTIPAATLPASALPSATSLGASA